MRIVELVTKEDEIFEAMVKAMLKERDLVVPTRDELRGIVKELTCALNLNDEEFEDKVREIETKINFVLEVF